jgi:hypothetical protein
MTAMISPLAVYIYETMKLRRNSINALEDSATTYLKDNIKIDIQSLSAIYEEIELHQAIFSTANSKKIKQKLSKSLYENNKKTGILGYLPGLRINKYYQYIDEYNLFVDQVNRLGKKEVNKSVIVLFNGVSKRYSSLNEILYVNLLYNMGRLQTTILAFPTVDFPTRYSKPYLMLLLESGIFGEIEEKNEDVRILVRKKEGGSKDIYNYENVYDLVKIIKEENVNIYSDENAYKFMNTIGKLFERRYLELQKEIDEAYEREFL